MTDITKHEHAERVRALPDNTTRRSYLEELDAEMLHAVAEAATGQKVHKRTAKEKMIDFTLRHLPAPAPAIETTTPVPATPLAVLKMVALAIIHPSPTNPRKHFDEGKLVELAASIAAVGVLQPLLLRPHPKKAGDFECVAGERRRRAALAAALAAAPANIRDMTDREVLEAQLVENGQRADVHPLEEADAIAHLHGAPHKVPVEEIAASLGRPVAYVYSRLRLTSLCEVAREHFLAGRLSAGVALLIARVSNPKQQDKAAKELAAPAERGDMLVSIGAARQHLERGYFLRLADAPFSTADTALVPGAGACTTCPKRSGKQGELFVEVAIDDDTCTDKDCYDKKVEASWKKRAKAAEAAGQKVLTGADAKKVFPYEYSSTPAHGTGYVALDEKCYEDPKQRTYGQLLKRELKGSKDLVLAQHPHTDRPVELLLKKDVTRLLRQAGHDFKKKRQEQEAKYEQSPAEKARAERWEKQREVDALTRKRAAAAAAEVVKGKPLDEYLRLLLVVDARIDDFRIRDVLEEQGVEIGEDEKLTEEQLVDKAITGKSAEDVKGMLFDVFAGPEMDFAVGLLGIDLTAINAAVRAELGLPPPRDPLEVACPSHGCRAKAGTPCVNYKNQSCAPHRQRIDAAQRLTDDDEEEEGDGDEEEASAKTEQGMCRVCHCTDADGCPEGCAWASEDETLCTTCVDYEDEKPTDTFRRLVDDHGLLVERLYERWPEIGPIVIDEILEEGRQKARPADTPEAAPPAKKRGKKAAS